MAFFLFLGIDVFKQTLDFALFNQEGQLMNQCQIQNSSPAIEHQLEQWSKLHQIQPPQLLICLKHTGIYDHHLLTAFTAIAYGVWLESSKQIRYSMGLQRGKSDAINAVNIARYASKNQREARLWKPESKILVQLKALTALRNHLIGAQNYRSPKLIESSLERSSSFFGESLE